MFYFFFIKYNVYNLFLFILPIYATTLSIIFLNYCFTFLLNRAYFYKLTLFFLHFS